MLYIKSFLYYTNVILLTHLQNVGCCHHYICVPLKVIAARRYAFVYMLIHKQKLALMLYQLHYGCNIDVTTV